jgi:hypothetical protein
MYQRLLESVDSIAFDGAGADHHTFVRPVSGALATRSREAAKEQVNQENQSFAV